MSKTNCINCGAAKDTSDIRCPFCGTTYLDMTAIDFTSHTPVVCQFVVPNGNDRVVVSALARPRLTEFRMEREQTYVCGKCGGSPLVAICNGVDAGIGIEFNLMRDTKSGNLFTVKKEDSITND